MKGLFTSLVATTLWLALASDAHARDVRRLGFKEKRGYLMVTGTVTDVFDATQLEDLSSGFVTNIVVRFGVYGPGDAEPRVVSFATRRVIFDRWDGDFHVEVVDMTSSREQRIRSRADALKVATTFWEVPIAQLSQIDVGPVYQLYVVVEVNPVSPESLAEVRRWLTRPQGRAAAGTGSFFGAVVSLFVNPKLDDAERVLRFWSQRFYRVD